ncbi:MAG: FtsW/RodA/SpoVE family cell cycle protein [Bacteroidales bacterium]|nr:FtsW/RodA/SpoVE family cell cycle protein [Candidatus Sodaliphilus aphodohippi]
MSDVKKRYGDTWIWGLYLALIGISIVENYSASSRNVSTMGIYMPLVKHCAFLAAGVFICWFISKQDYNKPRFLWLTIPILALFTVLMLILVMFVGEEVNGAQRAIPIIPGLFTIQPAEIAKLSVVTLLAFILARNQTGNDVSRGGLLKAIFVVLLFGGLMVKNGMTNFLLLIAICGTMFIVGGVSFKKLGIIIVITGVLGGLVALMFIMGAQNDQSIADANAKENIETVADTTNTDVNIGRSATWVARLQRHSSRDSLRFQPITGINSQEMFSTMAQAHGGLYGVGVGNSRECCRLPLAFSDYIYSIILEELGLVGGIVVLLIYLSLLGRALSIVQRCHRVLPALLILGMASLITFQALFHMAINVGWFPVSGQPLPLISNGGTSILVMSAAFGIMLSVSRTITNPKKQNKENDTVTLPEGLDAKNPLQYEPKNVWK